MDQGLDQEKMIDSLIQNGWFSCEGFLDPEISEQLVAELKLQSLSQAQIGRKENKVINHTIRTDSIYWLDQSNQSAIQNLYLEKMNHLMNALNQSLYLGLRQFEGHFAFYDVLGFYKKHLDQFSNNHDRKISVVTYLNDVETGGELVIYNRENPELVETQLKPRAGSLVCFFSNQIYHEVKETLNERYSIAGWFRTNVL